MSHHLTQLVFGDPTPGPMPPSAERKSEVSASLLHHLHAACCALSNRNTPCKFLRPAPLAGLVAGMVGWQQQATACGLLMHAASQSICKLRAVSTPWTLWLRSVCFSFNIAGLLPRKEAWHCSRRAWQGPPCDCQCEEGEPLLQRNSLPHV